MNVADIKHKIRNSSEYEFLNENEHLNNRIMLLGLGGSYAYGTNVEGSDIDIRGIAANSRREILLGKDFEQVVDENTDTVVYSFRKIVNLLMSCNPNTIEMLGLKNEHYIYKSRMGEVLLRNKDAFLSKRAINSFGGYANSQLRRLTNKSARSIDQSETERNILRSIETARYSFPEKYFKYPEDSIKLYTDKAVQDGLDTEIFMDIKLKHYPLRDYRAMWSEMNNIVRDYNKLGKRNANAIEHNKLGKHMMHLVRLYLMCFDILEKGEINTYREKERDWLLDIRGGKYLTEDKKPTQEFMDIVAELENKLAVLGEKTSLPDKPDIDRINNIVAEINASVVEGWYY